MPKNTIISPVSIDLGAKNTGVYFAHYEEGASIEDVGKTGEGKVYQLDEDKYTLLMEKRTAARHQRRGYDRRQMVKRLFKLIWENHFGLDWDKDIQQTISFLLNRRGFTFLTEEYDAEVLSRFPEKAYKCLPDKLKIKSNDNGEYDFASALTEWANKDKEEIKRMFDAIYEEPKRIRKELFVIKETKKLKKYCVEPWSKFVGKKINLDFPKWLLKEWGQPVQNLLPTPSGDKVNLDNYLSKNKTAEVQKILDSCQNLQCAKGGEASNGAEVQKILDSCQDCQKSLVSMLAGKSAGQAALAGSENSQKSLVSMLAGEATGQKILDNLPKDCALKVKEKELNDDIWNFRKSFSIEKTQLDADPPDAGSEKKWQKNHLHHLAFALQKILDELESGGRHRSKYYVEIKDVLQNERTKGRKKDGTPTGDDYIDRFCKKLHNGEYPDLTIDSLSKLIGHLSNLELKPLRKYFNDKNHQKSDDWKEARLSQIFDHWILHAWRVSEKDKNKKSKGHAQNYEDLKECWKKFVSDKECHIKTKDKKIPIAVIKFWLDKNPESTIPPYQDNNNRRPPRCQTLILNPTYLDNHYSEWQKWLRELKSKVHLEDFEKELKNLESGKGLPYFSNEKTGELKRDSGRRSLKELDGRILQFIFDRVKDPLKLNEIYSYAKKCRQSQSSIEEKEKAKNRLKEAISKLPDDLKTSTNYQNGAIFAKGSFLHLVCKYYKQRQRAKAGRMFIHPEYRYINGRGYENTGRFDDKDHLLTYCNHKPRQKHYQMLGDLANLLQIAPKQLEKFVQQRDGKTVDEKLFNWLKGIDTLKTNCDQAAKEQKNRRGRLKLDIQTLFGLIYHQRKSDSPSEKEIKEIVNKSKVDKAFKLYKFCKRAKKLCQEVTEPLYDNDKHWDINPATAVYLLAQINNLAFKERSGNAKTCAVCSVDNAQRMQRITSKNIAESHAKAQRLPAIPTRLIDGAVMRMARIVGGAIAKDKWEKIEKNLKADRKVRVPIITESNRFEFEPSLKEIKGKKPKGTEKKGQNNLADSKDKRIREASLGICPYTDKPLGKDGDWDHIIPRSSEWGTLNDEANLIWASDEGNEKVKKHDIFSLANLKPEYKQKQFETSKDDSEIEQWIIKEIDDEKGENFKFGKYHSFINLTPKQQKAFRHALFLVGHDLREKVISAIDNRNRTLVNGTQRHFAEVLANNLYKRAKKIDKQHLLSFDYLGVEAQSNTRGDGIHDLRKKYEKIGHEILKYTKQEGKTQLHYSHLIDAQLAFAIMADSHRNDGGLKLKINDSYNLWPVDKDTGEISQKTTIFDSIQIKPEKMNREELKRKKAKEGFFEHRTLFDSNPRAWHFLKLIEIDSGDKKHYWKGFLELKTLKSCLEHDIEEPGNENKKHYLYGSKLSPEEEGSLVSLYSPNEGKYQFGYQNEKQQWPKIIIENQKLGNKYFTIRLYEIDKTKVAQFLLEHFNTKNTPNNWKDKDRDTYKKLQKLWYFTKRKNLIKEGKPDFNYKEENLKTIFPNPSLSRAWKKLNKEWDRTGSDCSDFLEKHFLANKHLPHQTHQRVRKEFSLPIRSEGQSFMLIARRTWNNKFIYQCQSEKSGNAGTGLYKIRNKQGKLCPSLTPYFRSRNIVLLKELDKIKTVLLEQGAFIDEDKWYPLKVPCNKFKNVESIENKYMSKDDSKWRITFKKPPSMEDLFYLMYDGCHIDGLKVGKKDEKDKIKEDRKKYFQNKSGFMHIKESEEKLKKCQETINKKYKKNKQYKKTTEDKGQLHFITCWLNCLKGLNGRTLTYKRSVPLKIESA